MSKKITDIVRLKVIKTIESHNLLDNAKRVMAGFSGGADSSVLLDVLMSLRERYGFELSAVHVNHQIRGEESDHDEAFAKEVCHKAGIILWTVRVDVPALVKEKSLSLEDAARQARYEVFSKIAAENGIDLIATAHNADDNAETVLFNLTRGSALKGLGGIPYKRQNIIRPLLDVSRGEIEEYAKYKNIPYVTDSTNLSDLYTRNKIRHQVVPVLKGINPSFINTITSQSKLYDRISRYLSETAEKLDGDISDKDEVLILQYIYNRCPEFLDLETAWKIVNAVKAKARRKFAVTQSLYAFTEGGKVNFGSQTNDEPEYIEYTLLKEGKNILAKGNVVIYYNINSKNFNDINKKSTTITLHSDIINEDIFVRTRCEGDTLKISGITKSIKKEFINKKIPRKYRGLIPVICSGGDIVCVPFIGTSDKFKAKGENKSTFTVCLNFNVKTEKDGEYL